MSNGGWASCVPVDNACPTSSYPSSALNCCVTSLKNLSNSLAFALMVNFLPILTTLDVDECDFVSSSFMLVLCGTTSACSCVI